MESWMETMSFKAAIVGAVGGSVNVSGQLRLDKRAWAGRRLDLIELI